MLSTDYIIKMQVVAQAKSQILIFFETLRVDAVQGLYTVITNQVISIEFGYSRCVWTIRLKQ